MGRRGPLGSPPPCTTRCTAQFGRPIAGFQLTQAKLVDMAVELHEGQLLSLHPGRLKDSVGLRPDQVSFGKLNRTREAIEICRAARTILGGNGYRWSTRSSGIWSTWNRC